MSTSSGLASSGLKGLRIAQLIASDGPGGAERMLADLSGALRAGGAEVVAFLPAKGEGWLTRQLQSSGVAVEGYRLDRALSPSFARWLAGAFGAHRINLAHSHEFSFAVYGAWSARLAGIPNVITMHGGRYHAAYLRRRILMRLATAASCRLVAVSEPTRDALSRDLHLAPSRITLVPNGVAFEPMAQSSIRAELGLGPIARIALAVGNLYPVKGHTHLVAALGRLTPRHPDLHVVIAGRGDLAETLAAEARELGVAGRVHLVGLRSDIPNLLAGADLFVLPSLSEGLPLALLEAMFAGRPIVASAVGGVPAALGENGGVVVPPGDAEALAAAMDRVLSDGELSASYAASARARAVAEFGLDVMVSRYAALYRGCLGRSAQPAEPSAPR